MGDEADVAREQAEDAYVEEMARKHGDAAVLAAFQKTEAVPIPSDAPLEVRQRQENERRAFARANGWLMEKSYTNASGRTEVRDLWTFAGLSNIFHAENAGADKIVLGCGPMVGAPETKPMRCVEAGCRDAKPDQLGWIAVGVAAVEYGTKKRMVSRSGFACPHNAAYLVRDHLMADAETRAQSLSLRAFLGIQNATKEEIGPDTPAARAEVESQTWEEVPDDAECYQFFDGGGNGKAEPFGFRWKKSGQKGKPWILTHRTDSGAPPHPDLPLGCPFHAIPPKGGPLP